MHPNLGIGGIHKTSLSWTMVLLKEQQHAEGTRYLAMSKNPKSKFGCVRIGPVLQDNTTCYHEINLRYLSHQETVPNLGLSCPGQDTVI